MARDAASEAEPERPTPPSAEAETPSEATKGPEEVTVEGERTHPTRMSEDPDVSAFRVRREAFEAPGRRLSDALREAPGVQVTELGGLGSATTARLRGATSSQTPVYFGAVRLNDEVGGVADLGLVPPQFVQSMQVYRSHAPRAAAELGIGGAIVLTPREPDGNEARVRVDLGSYGTRALGVSNAFSSQARSTSLQLSLDGADNNYSFRDTRGTLFVPGDDRDRTLGNADSEGLGIWLSHTERWGGAETHFFFGHATRDQGAPKLALTPTEEARVRYDRTLAQVTSTWSSERSTWRLLSSMVRSETTLDDPRYELGSFANHVATPGERFEQALTSDHALSRRWLVFQRSSVSVERFRRIEQRASGLEPSVAATRLTSRIALGTELAITDALRVSGLVEGRCVSTTPLEGCGEVLPAGRVGSSYRWPAIEVFGSVGRAVRLPTLSELFGASPVLRGNAQLLPEEALTAELGLRLQSTGPRPSLWLDLAVFARESENLVLFVRTAQGYLTPQNRARSRTLGGDLVLGALPLSWVSLMLQLSLLDPRDTSPGRTTRNDFLPFLSAFSSSLVVKAEALRAERGGVDLNVGLRGTFQSSRFADPAGLGVIPEQANLDVEADLGLLERALIIRGSLRNFFDSQRFDVVGFPLPGRSVFFSLETQFK